ncbi:hypothetical protein BDU57DRAFT_234600 [Ampelomyces quisqualis]|uniref:Uncharacterized protein n=1 Tax=Ampelomyces quisqualis TaxID=50730 RepID=A0A6A5QR73_AMPQU|nr:hypothetical protein BDU57DRAFT_234600 [Ampelomyces quisqualis]
MGRDPNFSRRFTHAVHHDDLERTATAERPHLRPSHVVSSYHSSSALLPPTPPGPSSPVASASVITAPENCLRREEEWQPETDAEHAEARRQPSRKSVLQETHPHPNFQRRPSKLQKSPSRASTRPLLVQLSQPQRQTCTYNHAHTPSSPESLGRPSLKSLRHTSFLARRSPSALSLSGRPGTMFKTWTTITANPAPRDSWLAGQKKSNQRTCICWLFWLCLMLVIVGVVVTMAVLKTHDII